MKVLLDHNLSPRFARALNGYIGADGHEAVSLRDRFSPSAKDIDWLTELSADRERWIVISGDLRITRNAAERQIFRASSLIGFFLAPAWHGSLRDHERAGRLIERWPAIETQAGLIEGSGAFLVPIARSARFRPLPL